MPEKPESRSIISLGEVLWDLFPDGSRFGGAACNFACHVALLGGKITMVSAVGADERGDTALSIMQRLGVDTSCMQRIPDASTGTVGVSVDGEGKPTFVIHPNSAWDRIEWTSEIEASICGADSVYFGTLGQREPTSRATIQRAVRLAKERGIARILDVNLRKPFFDSQLIRESIALASVLKLSDEELPTVLTACELSRELSPRDALLSILNKYSLDLVAMTRGADGALLVTKQDFFDQPGIPTVVCDTVGAGDAFTASLAMELHSGATLSSKAFNACKVASAVCSYAGAIPS